MFLKITVRMHPISDEAGENEGEWYDILHETSINKVLINADKIIDITPLFEGDEYLIDMGETLYHISPAEYKRIAPLLTGEQVSVPTAPALPAVETVEYDRAMAVVSAIHGFENEANELLARHLRKEPMDRFYLENLLQALVDFYLAVVSADILAKSGDAS